MQTQIPASGLPFPTAPEVIFTHWREVLHGSGLTPGMQAVYTLAVSGYLEYCSRNAVSVTPGQCPGLSGRRHWPESLVERLRAHRDRLRGL